MKRMLPVLGLLTTLAVASPASAIDVPQTRQEFVKLVAAGEGGTAETLVVDKPFDKVYAILNERASTCLDVKVERTAYVGYVERSSSDWNPTLRPTGKGRAEFTLQVVHNPRGVGHIPPAGGLYVMAANLRSIDGGHTEVVLYRPNIGFKKIATSLKQWVGGDDSDCPKLR